MPPTATPDSNEAIEASELELGPTQRPNGKAGKGAGAPCASQRFDPGG
jgi:hypothetical protein